MAAVSRTLGDVLLGAFAVAVIAASVVVVQRGDDPAATTLTSASTPTHTVPTTASRSPVTGKPTLVVAGPDLAKLKDELATESGSTVEVVASTATDLVPAGALDDVVGTPSAVVLEIVAGTKTSVRTSAAISAVREKWADAEVFVIGPFSSADRKSATAAKTATESAHATFLDPVELKWRATATSPSLAAKDEAVVAQKLADALL